MIACICAHVCSCTFIHTRERPCACACICVGVHTCLHACVPMWAHVSIACVSVSGCVSVCTSVCPLVPVHVSRPPPPPGLRAPPGVWLTPLARLGQAWQPLPSCLLALGDLSVKNERACGRSCLFSYLALGSFREEEVVCRPDTQRFGAGVSCHGDPRAPGPCMLPGGMTHPPLPAPDDGPGAGTQASVCEAA